MLSKLLYYLFVSSLFLAWGVLALDMFRPFGAESLFNDALWWLCLAWVVMCHVGVSLMPDRHK